MAHFKIERADREAFILPPYTAQRGMMTDYQINLLDCAGHTASASSTKCADDREALGLAQRMVGGRERADVWAGARRVGRMSGASGADIKALGQPWASQPFTRA